MTAHRIPAADLEKLMIESLMRAGATQAMAASTTRALMAAELEGIASHGASRIPQYCGHLRNGRANGAAVPKIARDHKAACLVDAQGGLAFEACEL
ncbi:MAG TPA: Ldh family oxidoreductase, partial [Usitatibacter sp.]|nr:Ldh family oxidoreductase [Usitatibacter sp.]